MPDIPLYQPLEAGQIRLLTIVAINPTIQCRLELSSLSQTSTNWHPYNALSYVWGSEPFSETISCNGKPLNITPSLSDTLRQLFAYEDQSSAKHPVWIDAICLNQLDSAEMEVQVPLMYEVYSKASVVLVYLGRAQDNSDLAMTSATDLRDRLHAIDGGLLRTEMLPRLGIEDQEHPIWYAFESLLDRPWFSRVWTFQEAILAKKIIVGCGSKWLPWEVLGDLIVELRRVHILWLVERDWQRAQEIGAMLGSTAVREINFLRKSYDPDRGISLAQLLDASRFRVCTEPVDHLWGILGLMDQVTRDEIQSSEWVDYTDTGKSQFWRSYIKFARWMVQRDQSLYTFSAARSLLKPQQIPSWCPNWASPQKEYRFPWYIYSSGYNDVESRKLGITVQPEGDGVRVPGFRIDIIHQVVETCRGWVDSSKPYSSENRWRDLLEWESSCLQLSRSTLSSDNLLEALRRTLIADCSILTGDSAHKLCDKDPEYQYGLWKRTLGRIISGEGSNLSQSEAEAAENFHAAAHNVCHGRAFFSTSGGRIGLGPPDVKKGDVVCVFYSGRPLYIIRLKDRKEEGEDAELIGESYVDGLMRQRQAFESPDRGPDENFILV
jgi:hypothetical protein